MIDRDGILPWSYWISLAALYGLAFWALPANPWPIWDDWVIAAHSRAEIANMTRDLGLPFGWVGGWDSAFANLTGGFAFARLISFIAFLGAAAGLERALRRIPAMGSLERGLAVAIFALYPVNFGREIGSSSHYSISFFLFHLALALSFGERRAARAAAAALFFVSFTMNSLLVYFAVVPVFHRMSGKRWRDCVRPEWIVATSLFWVLRNTLWHPSGPYAQGYNVVDSKSLIQGFLALPLAWFHAGLKPWLREPWIAAREWTGGFLVVLLAALYPAWRIARAEPVEAKPALARLGLGLLASATGLFPYLAVGKFPTLYGPHTSGYAILAPLGAALTVSGAFAYLARISPPVARAAAALLLAALGATNARYYWWFKIDGMKHHALAVALRESPIAREKRRYQVDDRAPELNAMRRRVSLHEYSGILRRAFGDQARAAVPIDWSWNLIDEVPRTERYNLKDYEPGEPDSVIEIRDGELGRCLTRPCPLLWLEWSEEREFARRAIEFESREPSR